MSPQRGNVRLKRGEIRIVRRGRITTSWSDKRRMLHITYSNRDFCREVIVRTGKGDGEPAVNANGRLSFDVALKARR